MADPALEVPPVYLPPTVAELMPPRLWQGIPGLERTPGGRLWAAWYSGGKDEGPENFVLLAVSDDEGLTWTLPRLVVHPPGQVRAYDPCLWLDPLGRLWLFWAQSEGHFDGRCGVWAVVTEQPDADEPCWSAPRRLADGIMMNKPTVTADGRWLMPAAIWSHRPKSWPGLEQQRRSNLWQSTDLGRTWTLRGGAEVPQRGCDEHMIIERQDRSLWMLVRTQYGIGQAESSDGGGLWRTGSAFRQGPATRFFLRRLRSGSLLLAYHDHPSQRSHLTAWLSEDDGQTWPHRLLLDERLNVSYPDGAQGPDGTIFIIYDRDRRGVGEILLTRFTEADLRRGGHAPPPLVVDRLREG